MAAHRCEIHVEAEDESRAPTRPCGKPATWWSDDVSSGGGTVWLCERHMLECARSNAEFVFAGKETS